MTHSVAAARAAGPDIVLLVPDRLTAAFAYHIVIDAKLPGK